MEVRKSHAEAIGCHTFRATGITAYLANGGALEHKAALPDPRAAPYAADVAVPHVLADRLRQYAAVCGDGNAEARGDARTKTEALLPSDGWLGRLLAPTQGKVIGVEDVAGLFPPR